MAVRSKWVRTLNSNDRFESMVLHNTYLNRICTTRAQQRVSLERFDGDGIVLCSRRTYKNYFGIMDSAGYVILFLGHIREHIESREGFH